MGGVFFKESQNKKTSTCNHDHHDHEHYCDHDHNNEELWYFEKWYRIILVFLGQGLN